MTGTLPLFGAEQTALTSDDYYTPAWVFERMGITFDLDVAAPPGGIPWIPAARYFTKEQDGLAKYWHGRVWMNPPYSEPIRWVERFIEHRNGVALLPASNGRWFHDLWQAVDAITPPIDNSFKFSNGYGVPIRVFLFAFGPVCVEAIGRLGRVR